MRYAVIMAKSIVEFLLPQQLQMKITNHHCGAPQYSRHFNIVDIQTGGVEHLKLNRKKTAFVGSSSHVNTCGLMYTSTDACGGCNCSSYDCSLPNDDISGCRQATLEEMESS